MNKSEFIALAERLAQKMGGESDVCRAYFHVHCSRLWETGVHFGLWEVTGKSVLDIGPFYSYVPFALRERGNSVSVLEGPDSVINPLKPLYAEQHITLEVIDLFDVFQSRLPQERRLPFSDNQFDLVNCWETMEHFNFNPVGFVREVHRVLKPGGHAFITVPNMAKLDLRINLLLGRSIRTPVVDYQRFHEHDDGRFLGFHWREYVLDEIAELFRLQQFRVESAQHILTFQDRQDMGLPRRLARLLGRLTCTILPSCGSVCCLHAVK